MNEEKETPEIRRQQLLYTNFNDLAFTSLAIGYLRNFWGI